jgi:hypothetical protein|tara:strand:+ start:140 stop:259 length:120 start_codon:yes stop_codon:yes gene_type:complete
MNREELIEKILFLTKLTEEEDETDTTDLLNGNTQETRGA